MTSKNAPSVWDLAILMGSILLILLLVIAILQHRIEVLQEEVDMLKSAVRSHNVRLLKQENPELWSRFHRYVPEGEDDGGG